MSRQTIRRLPVSAIFLGMMMMAASLAAQPAESASPDGIGVQAQSARPAQPHANVQANSGCQRILAECRRLGFVYGQWKKDNGLWKDCFDPVVRGGAPTGDGKPVNVPVSAGDLQSCRAAVEHHPR